MIGYVWRRSVWCFGLIFLLFLCFVFFLLCFFGLWFRAVGVGGCLVLLVWFFVFEFGVFCFFVI